MKDLISIITNLKTLDMNKIKSMGYSLDICGKRIVIVRTPKKWIITIMTNNHLDYVCKFIFDVHNTIQVINGAMYMNIEKFISSIMESTHN